VKYFFFILAAGLALTAQSVRADDPAVPGASFPASRYEALWTKSPFQVATPDASPDSDSPDYSLVGIAEIDGVSYASLVEKQNNEHFLVSSDKSVRGLMLTSIIRNPNSSDTSAVVQKDGRTITLKLEQASTMAAPPGVPNVNRFTPGMMTPQMILPGANPTFPQSGQPFPARLRRPLIHLPLQQQSTLLHGGPIRGC